MAWMLWYVRNYGMDIYTLVDDSNIEKREDKLPDSNKIFINFSSKFAESASAAHMV